MIQCHRQSLLTSRDGFSHCKHRSPLAGLAVLVLDAGSLETTGLSVNFVLCAVMFVVALALWSLLQLQGWISASTDSVLCYIVAGMECEEGIIGGPHVSAESIRHGAHIYGWDTGSSHNSRDPVSPL